MGKGPELSGKGPRAKWERSKRTTHRRNDESSSGLSGSVLCGAVAAIVVSCNRDRLCKQTKQQRQAAQTNKTTETGCANKTTETGCSNKTTETGCANKTTEKGCANSTLITWETESKVGCACVCVSVCVVHAAVRASVLVCVWCMRARLRGTGALDGRGGREA